jgi:tetratricopeptide (TPR) repeat protein
LARDKRNRRPHRKPAGKPPSGSAGPRSELKLARRGEGNPPVWELTHPRCARERADDIEEVRAMLEAGEFDIARDELRWLLDGCTDFVDAHHLLGEIAFAEGDFSLARGHFGYVHRICTAAFPGEKLTGTLPAALPGNRLFFESGKALAYCLHELKLTAQALQLLDELRRLDPSDPLELAALWQSWSNEVQQIRLL